MIIQEMLIVLPILLAVVLFLVPTGKAQTVLVRSGAILVALFSLVLVYLSCNGVAAWWISFFSQHTTNYDTFLSIRDWFLSCLQPHNLWLDHIGFDHWALGGDILIFLLVMYLGIKARKWWAVVLMLAQFIPLMVFEFGEFALSGKGSIPESVHQVITRLEQSAYNHAFAIPNHLYTDNLSLIMAVIIGVVGGLIAIFAIPYMREFHQKHLEVKDRRPFFFGVIFLFLGAMFGIVFSDHLLWLYFFWEVTTLCSFLLIGYKGNPESVNNAFRALILNLVGGIGFVIAIYVFFFTNRSLSLGLLIASPGSFALVPAACLAFAGLAKAAQMPFSSWLLGAMVAPTPVSALLHSSTMVKAGVFLILKMATVFMGTTIGLLVASVGAVTFLGTSLMAIAQNDAKKVLAYSTIANLGLIVFCAGIGTAWAIWAAVLLIVFHAITKCLLFLCVGALENKSGSRDIERMDALIARAPLLAILMLAGMAGMFILPFGMLVSKWAVIRTLADASAWMTVFVAFGSAATAFFWLKWMGRLISVPTHPTERLTYTWDEKFSLSTLAVLMVIACAFFNKLSNAWVAPYISDVSGFGLPSFGLNNLGTIIGLLVLVLFLPVVLDLFSHSKSRQIGPYLSGANSADCWQYQGAQDASFGISNRNYYLAPYFGEAVLFRPTLIISIVILVVLAAMSFMAGGSL